MRDMIAAMGIRQEGFGAVRRPFDGAASDAFRSPYTRYLFAIDEDFGTQAAAHIGGDDPQLVFGGEAMEGRNHQARHMRILARGIKRIVLGTRVIGTDCGAGFQGVWNEPVVDDVKPGYMRR